MKKCNVSDGCNNIIGKKVCAVRKSKGLNQKDLSVAFLEKGIIISTSSISKLENQTRKVSDIELLALSEILNVSVDYLLSSD